jgi:hypothetical protein
MTHARNAYLSSLLCHYFDRIRRRGVGRRDLRAHTLHQHAHADTQCVTHLLDCACFGDDDADRHAAQSRTTGHHLHVARKHYSEGEAGERTERDNITPSWPSRPTPRRTSRDRRSLTATARRHPSRPVPRDDHVLSRTSHTSHIHHTRTCSKCRGSYGAPVGANSISLHAMCDHITYTHTPPSPPPTRTGRQDRTCPAWAGAVRVVAAQTPTTAADPARP